MKQIKYSNSNTSIRVAKFQGRLEVTSVHKTGNVTTFKKNVLNMTAHINNQYRTDDAYLSVNN